MSRVEKVTITPSLGNGGYGSEVDVSEFINIDGISKIKKSIDSTDYSVGVYTFDDLRLRGQNGSGMFNENDSRSIFPSTRDRSIVKVESLEINPEKGAVCGEAICGTAVCGEKIPVTSRTQFEGLLSEEATRLNITRDEVSFLIRSKDSIFQTTQVPAGSINNGVTVKQALVIILSAPAINEILNVDENNLNPDLNHVIDNANPLTNISVKDALDALMLSSNSVLIQDEGDNVIVRSRDEDTTTDPLRLFGRGSLNGTSNIYSISSYNSGRQRQFNSVILNDLVTVQDDNHITEYGLRQYSVDFDFVTNTTTLQTIGQRFIDEFKFPKVELKLRVPTRISQDYDLLDRVRMDAPFLKARNRDEFFPVCGSTLCGDASSPLPLIKGSVQILDNIKFKIISIEDNPKDFTTTLKIRQSGKSSNDGIFDDITDAILGTAICGVAISGKSST